MHIRHVHKTLGIAARRELQTLRNRGTTACLKTFRMAISPMHALGCTCNHMLGMSQASNADLNALPHCMEVHCTAEQSRGITSLGTEFSKMTWTLG